MHGSFIYICGDVLGQIGPDVQWITVNCSYKCFMFCTRCYKAMQIGGGVYEFCNTFFYCKFMI